MTFNALAEENVITGINYEIKLAKMEIRFVLQLME